MRTLAVIAGLVLALAGGLFTLQGLGVRRAARR